MATVNKYKISPTSIPTNTFTFKADVASSEGANNVIMAQMWNELNPFKTSAQVGNPNIRQSIEGKPIVIFQKDGNTYNFLGKYNFNNDKGTPEVFGFVPGDESWETLNNGGNKAQFKSWDDDNWQSDFECRYPKDGTDVTRLQSMAEWVISTKNNVQKFRNELSDWFDVGSVLFYYILTEVMLGVDSRTKNCFYCYDSGKGKWYLIVYDGDTILGCNNEGQLVFNYNLEDTDEISDGFGSTSKVFNGQDNVFWNNVRLAYGPEIKTMYQEMRNSGALSAEDIIRRFDEHQSKWPTAVFNEDTQKKYLDPLVLTNDSSYLTMIQGSKKAQRDWWITNRIKYLDSKYDAGNYSASANVITVRGYARDNITVTPYIDMYCGIKYANIEVKERGVRNQSYTLEYPAGIGDPNDVEIYIYGASEIAEISGLENLKVGWNNFASAVKLRELKLGDGDSEYSNPNLLSLGLGNNTLLTKIDCRNCVNLGRDTEGNISVAGCTAIEELYFEGTAVKGIDLPDGGQLRVMHLPNTITSLVIKNQKKIADLDITDGAVITTLVLENVSDAVDCDSLIENLPANSRLRYVGFDKEVESVDEIEAFMDIWDLHRGIDDAGLNTTQAQVAGRFHIGNVTGAQVAELNARYPYVVIDADHITAELKYYSEDGQTLLHTETVVDGANGVWTGTSTKASTAQYSYTFDGWSKTIGGNLASDAKTAVTADRSIYAHFSATIRTYTVTFKNGTTTLCTVNNVPYGGTATYTGPATNTLVDPNGTGNTFQSWNPSPSNITGNTTCVATYVLPILIEEISDSWDTIIQNIENDDYRTRYQIGNYKPLDLGSEGIVNMELVGFEKDVDEEGNIIRTSWLAKELLNSEVRWGSSVGGQSVSVTEQEFDTSWYLQDGIWYSNGHNDRYFHSCLYLTISNASYMTVRYFLTYGYLCVTECDSDLNNTYSYLNNYCTHSNSWKELIIDPEKLDSTYTLNLEHYNEYGSWSSKCARIEILTDGQVSVTKNDPLTTTYIAGYQGGVCDGWAMSNLRQFLNESVLELIPSNILSHLKESKVEYNAYTPSSTRCVYRYVNDKLWVPARTSSSEFINYPDRFKSRSDQKKATQNGTYTPYWFRNIPFAVPQAGSMRYVYDTALSVTTNGSGTQMGPPSNQNGVAIGFCI